MLRCAGVSTVGSLLNLHFVFQLDGVFCIIPVILKAFAWVYSPLGFPADICLRVGSWRVPDVVISSNRANPKVCLHYVHWTIPVPLRLLTLSST